MNLPATRAGVWQKVVEGNKRNPVYDVHHIYGSRYVAYAEGTYYARHRERQLQRERDYREANKSRRAEIERGWRERNPDKAKARGANYYEKNREHVLARCAATYAAKRERYRELHALHYLANKSAYVAKDAKRRAAEIRATPKWLTRAHLDEMKAIYAAAAAQKKDVDHIVPLQGKTVRGLHVPWNLQILSRAENRRKWNRLES